jgi:PAS domain S-box-containing protein
LVVIGVGEEGYAMSGDGIGNQDQLGLRLRALQQLTGVAGSREDGLSTSAALGVLYKMASEPSTAGSALALLHELQVHQVELELQDEELRRSRIELETTLRRQMQLYDHAPVAYFTVDQGTALRELNLTAAAMLGCGREQLLGRTLLAFLAPHSGRDLQRMLGRLAEGVATETSRLQLMVGAGAARTVLACAKCDPDGRYFVVVFVDSPAPGDVPAG